MDGMSVDEWMKASGSKVHMSQPFRTQHDLNVGLRIVRGEAKERRALAVALVEPREPISFRLYVGCKRPIEDGCPCFPGGIDGVIVRGGDKPMHPDWVRAIRDQCKAAGVPFVFDGWGEWLPFTQVRTEEQREAVSRTTISGEQTYFGARLVPGPQGMKSGTTPGVRPEQINKVGREIAGRLLDGVEHHELPEVPS